ncbi:MAG: TolC family protein [Acidobacteriota bacterium]
MAESKILPWLVVGQFLGLTAWGWSQTPIATAFEGAPPAAAESESSAPKGTPSRSPGVEELLAGVESDLRLVLEEVLERSPVIARARQRAAAAAARVPQVRAMPDPVASLKLFVLSPETRTGPQQFSVAIEQELPWFGKLALREQAALYATAVAEAEVEAVRLETLTEARRLVHELAFLSDYQGIVETERSALVRYERAAQARYSSGTGLQQEILRIQAQITHTDTRLLEIRERRIHLTAMLNALRDRPASEPIEPPPLPAVQTDSLSVEALCEFAASHRPEVAAAEARIAAAGTLGELARKNFLPDWRLGLSYTAVGRRDDDAGRRIAPEGNGDDTLALTGSVDLPVRRGKLAAGVEEADASRRAAEAERRRLLAEIEADIGDLVARIPLLFEHLELLEGVLQRQAREALRSAETAYSTGKLNAVDLLDAEVVLLEVRIAAARTRADLAIAWARLEHAVAAPLTPGTSALPTPRNPHRPESIP